MRYVEGVPRSEQILWFIDNYETKEYKSADRQHVITHKDKINNVDRREEIGVKCEQNVYVYLQWYENVERYKEVFYPVDSITLGELI